MSRLRPTRRQVVGLAAALRPRAVPVPVLVGLLTFALVATAALSLRAGTQLRDSEAGRLILGSAEVAADDGWELREPGMTIPVGADVRTGSGEVRIEMRGGEVWLGPGSSGRFDTHSVELATGELLLASAGTLQAGLDSTTVHGEVVARMTAGVTPRIGVYAGDAIIERPGETAEVPALRQTSLTSHRLAGTKVPLAYREDDTWDSELMARALTFDREVAKISRGINRSYGTAPQTIRFYRTFNAIDASSATLLRATAPRVESASRFGPPAEALVALFVARAATTAGLDEAEATARIVELREDGARWGLISLELDIDVGRFISAVDLGQQARQLAVSRALETAAQVASAAPGIDSLVPVTPPRSGAPDASAPEPEPSTSSDGDPPPGGTATGSPPSSSAPPPEDSGPEPGDLVGQEPPALGDVSVDGDEVEEVLEPITDPVDDAVDDAVDTILPGGDAPILSDIDTEPVEDVIAEVIDEVLPDTELPSLPLLP